MKLWAKGYDFDKAVERYTVGEDFRLDQALVVFDCWASLAHATMLHAIGVLDAEELQSLRRALNALQQENAQGRLIIKEEDEDCHTKIENYLVESCGEAGKKIHTARSRNDQVAVALRLFMKKELLTVMRQSIGLIELFIQFASEHARLPIPGRTHMQLAMPSSFGLWAGAIAESLCDDMLMLKHSYALIDQCPLGFAASYGSALKIDRALTASLLGFAKVQNNVLYASNSRGKLEANVMHSLHQVMLSLTKASVDLMFFSLPELAYITLPKELCSGSSLMPQKHNPCALELLRAKSATSLSLLLQVLEIIRALPSGYHRDFQETKAPLMKSFSITQSSLNIVALHIARVQMNENNCLSAFRPELFATDRVLKLSEEGIPFREAYQAVAQKLETIEKDDPVKNILKKAHLGAPGNLGLELLEEALLDEKRFLLNEETRFASLEQWFKGKNDEQRS